MAAAEEGVVDAGGAGTAVVAGRASQSPAYLPRVPLPLRGQSGKYSGPGQSEGMVIPPRQLEALVGVDVGCAAGVARPSR
ncbi:MAG: hypothetical protein QOE61_3225 [Micromonosporaceae bacterium]|nr:hypothetical protein [Micromonosporaceae bacterium]